MAKVNKISLTTKMKVAFVSLVENPGFGFEKDPKTEYSERVVLAIGEL